jgi:hypothetical protein
MKVLTVDENCARCKGTGKLHMGDVQMKWMIDVKRYEEVVMLCPCVHFVELDPLKKTGEEVK